MKAVKSDDYKMSHISTSTSIKRVEGEDHVISFIIVDIFKSYNDPDHFVTFQVEHINPKRMFEECEFNLN